MHVSVLCLVPGRAGLAVPRQPWVMRTKYPLCGVWCCCSVMLGNLGELNVFSTASGGLLGTQGH